MTLAYTIARQGMTRIYNACLHTPPVLDAADYFPRAACFTDAWRGIREEALAVRASLGKVPRFHEIMQEQAGLSSYGGKEWRMFVLRAYGMDIRDNLQRCPTLAGLLQQDQSIKSATLSFLAPGKRVPTHTGPFRGIVRFHLGLDMPLDDSGQPGTILTIAGEDHRLGNGEALLWDDTYPHSAVNTTSQWRTALLMDIYRSHMSVPLRLFTDAVLAMARQSIRWRGVFPKEFL